MAQERAPEGLTGGHGGRLREMGRSKQHWTPWFAEWGSGGDAFTVLAQITGWVVKDEGGARGKAEKMTGLQRPSLPYL